METLTKEISLFAPLYYDEIVYIEMCYQRPVIEFNQ